MSYSCEKFHKILKKKAHDTSIMALSRELSISAPTITNYLNNATSPRLEYLCQVARKLGMTVSELVGDIKPLDGKILARLKTMSRDQKLALLKSLET